MPAKITITKIAPSPDTVISQSSAFVFSLVPYNDEQVDIASLQMVLSIVGGGDSVQLTLNSSSADVSYTGDALNGYEITIRPMSISEYLLPTRANVSLKISVANTDAMAAKTRIFRWVVVDEKLIDAVHDLLREVIEVRVQYEQGRILQDGKTVEFTWSGWLSNAEPKVYLNGVLIDTGFTIDKENGLIVFSSALSTGRPQGITPGDDWDIVDVVNCDYIFSAFKDSELISYMNLAMGQFNSANPGTGYTLFSAPTHALAAAMIGGAYFALNSILIGFVNQQSRVKWGEADWQNLASTLSGNMSFYKERFEFMLAQKKFRLPNSLSIVFPEYNLPGGRQRFVNFIFGSGYDY